MEEPTIIVVLKEDHKLGFHKDANKYCPLCIEEQIVREVVDFLKEQENK